MVGERFEQARAWLQRVRRPLLLTHRRPDGDALGALVAVARVLRSWRKRPRVVLFDPWPRRYAMLESAVQAAVWNDVNPRELARCDGVVILDTCALSQLEPARFFLENPPPTCVFDHHQTRDDLGTRPGDLRLIDPEASATCLILHEWLRACGVRLEKPVATALFVGIATDCGWFRYSSTDPRTLHAAAELLDAGVQPDTLYRQIYENEPAARLRLLAKALERLELHADGQVAVMALRRWDFARCGGDHSMTDDLVNEAGRIEGVELYMLATELGTGHVKFNFRSKQRVNVAELAARFGGGGHARAAGARVAGRFNEVVPKVIRAAVQAVRAQRHPGD